MHIHPAELSPDELAAECEMRFTRRSGPGGQHRNKTSTAVVLTHRLTGVMAEAAERRSQAENRAVAFFRLRINLAIEVRINRPTESVPSALWQSRAGGGRINISPTHEDFPAMLAEALDMFAAHGFDPKPTGESLGCGVSQLVKFLKKEPRAFALVNCERQSRGLHPLC